jgi:hypothetical protein
MKARTAAVLPALVLLASCLDHSTTPSVAMGSEFLLKPAEAVQLSGTGATLRFEAVAADSRCPADALCITAGDATAVFTLTRAGASTNLSLHTAADARRSTVEDLTLTLLRLDPYPYAARPVAPSDYRASLRVDPAFAN